MNEIDYWFLNLAVQVPVSFLTIMPYDQCIVPDPDLTPSNLSTDQITDILSHLFQDGLLLAITPADLNSLDIPLINQLTSKSFIPSKEQIKTALSREIFCDEELYNEFYSKELYFFMTNKGGKLWESQYKPKWNQYFRKCILNWESISANIHNNSIPPNGSIICCADQEVAKKIIAIEHLLNREQFIVYPIKESILWETFIPWHPTYWKTLPHGYVVSYQAKLVEVDIRANNIIESKELSKQIQKAREWYMNTVNWYTKK